MMALFDTLTVKQALGQIRDREAGWMQANIRFYNGDHWQNGEGWSGPRLDVKHPLYNNTLMEIMRTFVSKNVVKEVVDRHVAGVAGKEPGWGVTVRRMLAEGEEPGADERALIAEAEELLVSWWDGQFGLVGKGDELAGAHKIVQSVVSTALLGKRGVLRLFVPPGELNEAGQVPPGSLAESVKRIFVHHPEPDQSGVGVERSRLAQLGVYSYLGGVDGKEELAELTYLDGQSTMLRVIKEGGEVVNEARLALRGRLTMFELHRTLLVTDQVLQQQKMLNLAKTMMQRNVIQGGFLERTFFNTQMPGKNVADTDRPGTTRFVPEPFHTGPGVTNFLAGVTYTDADGNQQVASPSVVYRDPVAVGTFEDTERSAYRGILEEVHQLHALISGDAAASGESRVQARSDFEQSLLLTKPEVEAALRWLLETVLAMAAQFSQQPGRYDGLRVNAEARIDTGPVTADEQRIVGELVDKKLLSKTTGRQRVKVEDTDAEAALVAQESEQEQQLLGTALLNAQRRLDGGNQGVGIGGEIPGGVALESAPDNLQSTKGLNGAQITAAVGLIEQLAAGRIEKAAAIELIVSMGVERQRAELIINGG
jgi:hypothetical protein